VIDGNLAFSVPGQERVQICVGDPKNAIEPVGYKLFGVDPAANRPARDTQRFRDVGYREKPLTVCAIAPSADCISEVNLRFQGSIMSHVNVPGSDSGPLPSTAPSGRDGLCALPDGSLARSIIRSSASTGTRRSRPIFMTGMSPLAAAS
jgi:hypothetical protein